MKRLELTPRRVLRDFAIVVVLAFIAALAIKVVSAEATGNHQPRPQPKPQPVCECCRDLGDQFTTLNQVFNTYRTENDQRVTNLTTRVEQLENTVVNLTNYIDAVNVRVTTVINRIEELRCTSNRIYTFRLRTEVGGVPIARVVRVTAAGNSKRGEFRRNGGGRFVISANYQGIVATRLQFRTVVVEAVLADGREVRLVQYVRLCSGGPGGGGSNDGNPNDTPAQDRAGR